VIRFIALALATLGAAADCGLSAAAQAVCNHDPAAAPALARLRARWRAGASWLSTDVPAGDKRPRHAADAASIRADLATLRPRFDSLITYDAVHGAENIRPSRRP